MKSKDVVSLSLLFVCTAVLAFSVAFYSASKNIGNKIVSRKTETTSNDTTVFSKYTVGEFNGKIAVYYGDNVLPDEIYDSYLDSLPDEDIKRLNVGITVYSKEEVQKLIEDYTS